MTVTKVRPEVEPRVERRARYAVVAVFFTHGLLFASWTAHIPQVKDHLSLDDGTLGLALLGTPIGSVTATLLTGFLVPRLGSRLLVQITLTGYVLSGPLVGLTGSTFGLFAALVLWGAFQGTLDVSMNTQAIGVEGLRTRPLMNGMHACWSFGAFAGAGVGVLGVALGVSLSWQLLIIGVPVLLVAGWLSTRMLLDRTPPAAPDEPRPARRFTAAMAVLGAIALASMLCEGAAADWSSVYLRNSLGASAGAAGLAYVVFALAMVAVRMSGDRLIARLGAPRVIAPTAALAAVAMAVALPIGNVVVSLVAFFVLGLGVGAVVPTAFSAAGRLPGVHPGQGVAGVAALGWAGFVCGPPIIGQLSQLTSLPTALLIVPILCAAVAVAAVRSQALRG